MKILVTGGSGFVGSHIVEKLIFEGHEIFALKREKEGWLSGLEVERVKGDLTNPDDIKLPKNLEVVIHTAGLTKAKDPSDYWRVNSIGTYNLIRALKKNSQDPFFIYISSQAAGGPGEITEEDPLRPITEYGESKLLGEYFVMNSGFDYLILRPCVIFGPRDRDLLLFFKIIKRGILPSFFERKRISVIYVKNMVDALLFLMKSAQRGVFYLSDGDYAWAEVAEKVAEIMQTRLKKVPFTDNVLKPLGFFTHVYRCIFSRQVLLSREKIKEMLQDVWVCSNKKLLSCGFKFSYTLEEALKETIEWYKEKGEL